MSNAISRHMVSLYEQDRDPSMFLTGFFQSPEENFFNSEEVEFDILRSGEDVAIPVRDLSTGANLITLDSYTNKSFAPPIYKDKFALNAYKLLERRAGENPFENADFMAKALREALRGTRKLEMIHVRALELQASLVLTTGTAVLLDDAGAQRFSIDYKPKATHFPTAGTAWSAASPTIADDIISLCDAIREDGLTDPDIAIMGSASFEAMINDDDIKTRLDTRRIDMGNISPMTDAAGMGGKYRGTLDFGDHRLDIWTYSGRYKHPQTGVSTRFIGDDKVIIMSSGARLDAMYGGVPMFPGEPALAGLPDRIATPGSRDINLNSWITDNRENLFVQASMRPLLVPTAIDTFGCLDTGI